MPVAISGQSLEINGMTKVVDTARLDRFLDDGRLLVLLGFTDRRDGSLYAVTIVRNRADHSHGTPRLRRTGDDLDGNAPVHVGTRLYGQAGEDDLRAGDHADTMHGGANNDDMSGNDGGDLMYGGYGGFDVMFGGDGSDTMYGGDGGAGGNDEGETDWIRGDAGSDLLHGEGGADDLEGGAGNDLMYGGDGNDDLDPGDGADSAYGGGGKDTFRNSLDMLTDWLDGGAGTDSAGSQGIDYDSPGDSLFNFP